MYKGKLVVGDRGREWYSCQLHQLVIFDRRSEFRKQREQLQRLRGVVRTQLLISRLLPPLHRQQRQRSLRPGRMYQLTLTERPVVKAGR